MNKKIWKMCVVALMLASPAVCGAVDIAEAVADPGDGKYVEMSPHNPDSQVYSSIDLSFPESYPAGTEFRLKFADKPNGGIEVQFLTASGGYLDKIELYNDPGLQTYELTAPSPDNSGGWSRLRITVYDTAYPVYLDAVRAIHGSQPYGTYVDLSAHGTVTPLTDNPADMISALAGMVATINDAHGIPNSLDAKLDAAWRALDEVHGSNPAAAVNKLEAFVNEVNAQSGKQIDSADATILVSGVPDDNFKGALSIIGVIRTLYGV